MAGYDLPPGVPLLLVVLFTVAFFVLQSWWESFLENVVPLLFVGGFILVAVGWGALEGNNTARGSARRLSTGPSQVVAGQRRRQQQLPRRRGSSRQLLEAPAEEGGLVRVDSGSPGPNARALTQSADTSLALSAEGGVSFQCTKPFGCGFRHTCADTRRSCMHCDQHGHHPAPADGIVWREVVPEGEAFAGEHRLLMSWGGQVLDITEMGRCRGWDGQLTAEMMSMLGRGQRSAGMCSVSSQFPRLEKFVEVAPMDPRAVERGQRLWVKFERWMGRKKRAEAQPRAITAAPASPG